jgi:hypothetical protein
MLEDGTQSALTIGSGPARDTGLARLAAAARGRGWYEESFVVLDRVTSEEIKLTEMAATLSDMIAAGEKQKAVERALTLPRGRRFDVRYEVAKRLADLGEEDLIRRLFDLETGSTEARELLGVLALNYARNGDTTRALELLAQASGEVLDDDARAAQVDEWISRDEGAAALALMDKISSSSRRDAAVANLVADLYFIAEIDNLEVEKRIEEISIPAMRERNLVLFVDYLIITNQTKDALRLIPKIESEADRKALESRFAVSMVDFAPLDQVEAYATRAASEPAYAEEVYATLAERYVMEGMLIEAGRIVERNLLHRADRDRVNALISIAQARLGNADLAVASASKIEDTRLATGLQNDLAFALIAAGQIKPALMMAKANVDSLISDIVFLEIVKAYANAGDIRQALDVVAEISQPGNRVQAYAHLLAHLSGHPLPRLPATA